MNEREKKSIIWRTSNYEIFKRLEGNRSVPETRIKKIIKSIEKVGYVMSPICVNEDMEVIDGQGRLEALKRLNLPVDYYVVNNIGIDECVALNIYQTNWTLMDYIDSYAETGNSSYIYLQQLLKEYSSDLGVVPVYNAITGKVDSANSIIRDGKFVCTANDYKEAIKILNFERRFKPFLRRIRGNVRFYYTSIGFCFRHRKIDNERLYDKMEQMQAELIPTSTAEQTLDILERIYNNRARNKVYILTEYKKMLDNKYGWYRKKWMKENAE